MKRQGQREWTNFTNKMPSVCVRAREFREWEGGGKVYAGHVWIPLGWMSKESQGGPIRAAKAGFTLITIIRYCSLTHSLPPSFSLSSCLALQRLFDRWKELVFFSAVWCTKAKEEKRKKSLKMGFLCPMCKFIREVSGDGRSWGFSFVISLFFNLKGGTAMLAVLDPLVHIPAVKCKRCSSS